ncbi:MAG: SDR family NAD(P)-dependent oxidoreductase [Deltaproteobacteria bacterium]|nr:SDR family NAD(P)-dependent oxidoreductase [Deltaproteobacteria bacterium]
METFKGKTAIVTGGASGIGRGLCEALCQMGAMVYVADIDDDGAKQVADGIKANGGRASAHRLDVTRHEEVEQLIGDVVERSGRLDYMFNNAGIGIGGELRDMEISHWKRIIDVNLWGVIYGTHAAYKVMVEQGSGHIVNTASLAGLIPAPFETAYATTKFGVVGLSTSLRTEGEALGIKVSVVCPGFIKTNIFSSSKVCGLREDCMDELIAAIPFKIMDPQKAAEIILKNTAKNKAVILVTPHGHVLYRLYKYFPWIAALLGRKSIGDFRKIRDRMGVGRS